MTELEQKLNTLKSIRLSTEARSRMRAELSAYADVHTVMPAPASTPRATWRAFTFRIYAGVAAVLVIMVGAGGTAFAAESSLPGDILYPIKVKISEPIQTALVPSDKGKAAWHAILAERRLEEAAQLAAENRLSPEVQTELAANFNENVVASEQSADRLQHAGDATGSLSVRSDLEARLSANVQILSIISAHYAAATTTDASTTQLALTDLLSTVKTHEHAVAQMRLALEDAIAPNASSTPTLAIATQTSVAKHLPAAFKLYSEDSPEADIQSSNEARTREVDHIIERHAALLAKFMPIGTTTVATTTEATSTPSEEASTTIENLHDDESGE